MPKDPFPGGTEKLRHEALLASASRRKKRTLRFSIGYILIRGQVAENSYTHCFHLSSPILAVLKRLEIFEEALAHSCGSCCRDRSRVAAAHNRFPKLRRMAKRSVASLLATLRSHKASSPAMLDEAYQMGLSAKMPRFTYQLVFKYPDGAIRLPPTDTRTFEAADLDAAKVVAERYLGQVHAWNKANAVRLADEHGAKVAFRSLTGDWNA